MRRFTLALVALALGFLNGVCPAAEDGWKTLFNGKDLTGWKVSENKDSVYVEDGHLVTHGPRSHAFYVGTGDGSEIYKNFHFQAEAKTGPKANSGIYFHTRYLDEGWPNRGYEVQVNNTHGDPKKTGGLYNVQDNFEAVATDGTWFKYDVIVKGKHIVVKIDGKIISDYTEPDDLDRPDRQPT